MPNFSLTNARIGWMGVGRMGHAMAKRLLEAGFELAVYNRTRSKAEPLAEMGAHIVDTPAELADCDATFTTVSDTEALKAVISGNLGLLSRPATAPRIHVDCSSVSAEGSAAVRADLNQRGTAMIAAPVSGNAKAVQAGQLALVASGPRQAFDDVLPVLRTLGRGVSYVGEGERARMVKICHNILLAVVTQSLAETTVLAEKGGVPRHAFLDFINNSVMGSPFTRYKTPAFANLDWTPTFTPELLRKDLDLGLEAGRLHDVPQPLTALTREIVQTMIGHGYTNCDFAALLKIQAIASGHELISENIDISDGLSG